MLLQIRNLSISRYINKEKKSFLNMKIIFSSIKMLQQDKYFEKKKMEL